MGRAGGAVGSRRTAARKIVPRRDVTPVTTGERGWLRVYDDIAVCIRVGAHQRGFVLHSLSTASIAVEDQHETLGSVSIVTRGKVHVVRAIETIKRHWKRLSLSYNCRRCLTTPSASPRSTGVCWCFRSKCYHKHERQNEQGDQCQRTVPEIGLHLSLL